MKKKSLKSLSLKKSNIANVTGGLQDGAANQQQQQAVSLLGCPSGTIILTIHTVDPWRCPSMSRNSICEWCKTMG